MRRMQAQGWHAGNTATPQLGALDDKTSGVRVDGGILWVAIRGEVSCEFLLGLICGEQSSQHRKVNSRQPLPLQCLFNCCLLT